MENYASNWKWEQLFVKNGPFVHLYTKPLETTLLVEDEQDRKTLLNLIALESREQSIDILAYALMSNHFHLILQADEEASRVFYDNLHRRIIRYLNGRGKKEQIAGMTCGTTRITSLKQFRDEVSYVIRNPFVVRDDINLFTYRWCSGFLYFNPFLNAVSGKPGRELSYRERRKICKTSDGDIPEGLMVENGLILPQSFVNYRLVENLFGNARQFLFWVIRNVEAQIEVAKSYGESLSLSDDELFKISRDICRKRFASHSPSEMTEPQKKEFAMILRKEYSASNGQIARLAGIDIGIVNQLYPLTSKTR